MMKRLWAVILIVFIGHALSMLNSSPAEAQLSGSYTVSSTPFCITFNSSGDATALTSGSCTTCTYNIDFDFSVTTGCDVVAIEEEIP